MSFIRNEKIWIRNDFLSKEDLELFNSFVRDPNSWAFDSSHIDHDFWKNRIIKIDRIAEPVKSPMIAAARRIEKIVGGVNGIDRLYPDTLEFVRWTKGYELTPHADAEFPDKSKHPFPYREFASMVYLNEDYIGGKLYFPNKNYTPEVRAGTLAFFPGTLEYLHGVTEVTEGVRYTMAMFWSRNPKHSSVKEW